MSSYATERSLLLTVEAQDLTEGIFGNVAGELERLADQAVTTFDVAGRAATEAADTIKAAAGTIPGFWQDQLQAVADFAALAFSEISAAAYESASGTAAAASPIQAAWTAPFDSISASARSASESVSTSFNEAADVASTDAEKMNSSATDVGAGFDKAAASANGFDAKVKASMDGAVTTAAQDAAKINGSVSDVAGSLDKAATAANGFDDKLKVALDGAASTTNGDSAKIKGSLDDITGAIKGVGTAGDLMKTGIAAAMDATATTVGADADKVDTSLKGIQTVARETALALERNLGIGTDATLLAGGKGGKGRAGATAASSDSSVLSKLGLNDISGKLLTGGITAAIGISALNMADTQLHTIGAFQQQTGMGMEPTVQALMAAAYMHVGDSQLQAMSARLQLRLAQAQKTGTPTLGGVPVSEGMGRLGINPAGLTQLVSSSKTGPAAALKLLGIDAATLQGMPANQQLALIATRLDEIKNANVRTATAMELFGGKGATSLLPLLNEFAVANKAAASRLSSGPGKQLLVDLQSELGGGGKGLGNYQMSMYMLELQMSTALIKLTPAIEALTKGTSLLIAWLEKHLGGKSTVGHAIDFVTHPGTSKWGKEIQRHDPLASGGAIDKWLSTIGGSPSASSSTAMSPFSQAAYGRVDQGVDVHQGGAYGALAAGKITRIGSIAGGSNKVVYDQFNRPVTIGGRTYTGEYVGETAPIAHLGQHVTAGQSLAGGGSAEVGLTAGTGKNIHPAGPLIGGLGAGTKQTQAGKDMLAIMLALPGALNAAGKAAAEAELKIKAPIDKAMTGTHTSVTKHAAAIPPPIDKALLQLVDAALKHGKEYSGNVDKMLKEGETFLKQAQPRMTTAGQDLMKGLLLGLQRERQPLLSEAHSIAMAIEAEIRNALRTHSPSEVTAAIGADVVSGLGLGMRRSTPDLLNTARSTAGALTGSLQGGGGIGRGGAGQTVINVYASGNVARSEEELAQRIGDHIQARLWGQITHVGLSSNF